MPGSLNCGIWHQCRAIWSRLPSGAECPIVSVKTSFENPLISKDILNKLLLMKSLETPNLALALENTAAWRDLREAMIAAREQQGLTQQQLAEVMGITQSAVSQFESLGGNPRMTTVVAYAQALQLKLSFDATRADDK